MADEKNSLVAIQAVSNFFFHLPSLAGQNYFEVQA